MLRHPYFFMLSRFSIVIARALFMKILTLTLSGYKRLLNNNIGYIKLNFTNDHQLILGTNGSGKSSIIAELSPLPAFGGDYVKGGYKEVVIEHRGHSYQLISFFDSQAGTHLFYKDGVQLNQGRIVSMQKELVEQEFNFNTDLFDVLTDQAIFHLMSPNLRQEWFTRLSGNDLDYLFQIFNQVKVGQRNAVGAFKHINERLAKETTQIKSDDEITALETKVKSLGQEIGLINRHLKPETVNLKNIEERLYNNRDRILQLKQSVDKINHQNNSKTVKSIDELKGLINVTMGKVEGIKTYRSGLISEVFELKERQKDIDSVADIELDTVVKQLADINSNIEEYRRIIKTFDIQSLNGVALYYNFDGIRNDVFAVIEALPDNSDNRINRENFDYLKLNIQELRERINNEITRKTQLEHKLNHYNQIKDVTCPECDATFKPNTAGFDLDKLTDEIREYDERIAAGRDKLAELETGQVTVYEDYYEKHRNFRRVQRPGVGLDLLWDAYKTVNLTQQSPVMLLGITQRFEQEVSALMQLQTQSKEAIRLEAIIAKIKDMDALSGKHVQETLDSLDQKIQQADIEIHEYDCALDFLKWQLETATELLDIEQKIANHLTRIEQLTIDYYDGAAQQYLSGLYDELLLTLSDVQRELNKARSQKDILNDLTNQRDLLEIKTTHLKLLLDELSPKTGLIADQFINFLIGFIELMNAVIRSVWSYDMELVLQSDEEKTNLSFKFPIYFSQTDSWSPDPAKCSTAQKGIIDFAFKIAVIQTLGLTDYPLYLDELAPSLDEKHRINIMQYVKEFIETKQCSQMFMVSHYNSGYGVFAQAQVAVLDSANLLNIPNVYNEHVTIFEEPQPFEEES